MDYFTFKQGDLYAEDLKVSTIAEEVGTPFYLYSAATIERHFNAYRDALKDVPHLICYAVKANSNLAVLGLLGGLGAGADIVSGGELFRCSLAHIPGQRIVYSGAGKTKREIEEALNQGILMFNVESMGELEAIREVAGSTGKVASISFRVNPDVDPKTHPYISTGLEKNKFGLPVKEAMEAYKYASTLKEVSIRGISCHIGSQLTEISPFVDALKRVLGLVDELSALGIEVEFLDMGGGLGIRYDHETPPHPRDYAEALKALIRGRDLTLVVEPGRSIVGNAGILVTRVLYRKETPKKAFLIVDAAMNDLARPSLYDAYHEISPVKEKETPLKTFDVVGPICETGDFFARSRELRDVEPGELLAIKSAGAYGFTMSSNYNSRPRVAEVMVRGNRFQVVRDREAFEDLVKGERFFHDQF